MAGEQQVIDGEIIDVKDNETITDDSDDSDLSDTSSDDSSDLDDGDESDESDGKKEVETWMADESEQQPSDVPVSTHIRMKQKLKGKLSDKNDELEKLKEENETLKTGMVVSSPQLKELPKKPKEDDFETLSEYDEALAEYDQRMVDVRFDTANKRVEVQRTFQAAKVKLEKTIDDHYSRAAKLIQDNGIDTEVYKAADLIVREAIETLMPGKGDITTDQIISTIGEGSEKVMYFLGRNKNALNELKSLLIEDSSGLKAVLFLGQQRERLLNTKQKISKAPPPGSNISGDDKSSSVKAKSFLKKRKVAIKNGDIQAAYDMKKQAKAAGVDVSNW
jgi:hypothetical protein